MLLQAQRHHHCLPLVVETTPFLQQLLHPLDAVLALTPLIKIEPCRLLHFAFAVVCLLPDRTKMFLQLPDIVSLVALDSICLILLPHLLTTHLLLHFPLHLALQLSDQELLLDNLVLRQ